MSNEVTVESTLHTDEYQVEFVDSSSELFANEAIIKNKRTGNGAYVTTASAKRLREALAQAEEVEAAHCPEHVRAYFKSLIIMQHGA